MTGLDASLSGFTQALEALRNAPGRPKPPPAPARITAALSAADGFVVATVQGCRACRDTGSMFETRTRDGGSTEYEFAVPCAACGRKRRQAELYGRARLPSEHARSGLTGAGVRQFRTDFDPSHVLALEAAQRAAEADASAAGLFLFGPPGVGKTHLLCGVAHRLIRRLVSVRYETEGTMLGRIKATFDGEGSSARVVEALTSRDVLILDELGALKATEWGVSTVADVVTRRFNAGRATLIGANYGPAQLAKVYGEHVIDRLTCRGGGVGMAGESQRGRT